jgi:hypothetical protein
MKSPVAQRVAGLSFSAEGHFNTQGADSVTAVIQVHSEYPRTDIWLREVKPEILALDPTCNANCTGCSDPKVGDACWALTSVRRWIDNGDGTVSDYVTGLVWEKKHTLGGISDKNNRYTWCADVAP